PQFAIRNPQSLQAIRLVPSQRKIFSQSVTLPVIRQKEAAQIRMSVEDYPKKIVRLALVPVRGAPNSGDGRHVYVVFVEQDLEPEPLITLRRKEVIVDFKTWVFFRPTIESAQVGEEIKLEARSQFHEPARGHYLLAWDGNRRLAQRFDNFGGPIRVFTLKRRRNQRRRAYLLGVTGLIVLDCLLSVLFVHLTLRFSGNAQNDRRFSCREVIV